MGTAAVVQQCQRAVELGVGILRQRQHNIAADFGEAGLPRPSQRLRRPGSGVGAAKAAQLRVVGTLHTKADPRHARCPEAAQRLRRDDVWVRLQRDLCAGQGGSGFYQGVHLFRRQQRGRAAAEIHRVGAAGALAKLAQQRVDVVLRHAARARRGIKVAVPAF